MSDSPAVLATGKAVSAERTTSGAVLGRELGAQVAATVVRKAMRFGAFDGLNAIQLYSRWTLTTGSRCEILLMR